MTVFIKDALFEDDLKRIKKSLLEMADLVSEALRRSMKALQSGNKEMALEALDEDDAIDLKEVEIEESCLRVIALRHPVREDLREVFTILKIITDLERMGDEAANIAKLVTKFSGRPSSQGINTVSVMAQTCIDMLKSAIKALIERNAVLAEEAFRKDTLLDELYAEMLNSTLFSETSVGDNSRERMYLLFVTRFLERFGDHASNIAERVYYMVTGRRIKIELGIRRGYSSE